ncbi:LANO_0E14972g1_1 [Lachancea nothofagi CBS 11611]|uniref:AP complex subunit beta n=1 Tax=Lachancea nothofagi CBS 11611 TaxID=1266666 RepID=A0A1G4K0I6_9SACH|nr:LANO_0E14972g1_1 [Lachancea nothofagi CBS 11611]
MSDQRIFSKYKAHEIRSELQQGNSKKHRASAIKRKNALKKIVVNLSMGFSSEMALLFPEILQYWHIDDDMEVKRICHHFLVAMAPTKSANFQEALRLVTEDFNSGNEPLRVLALRTLSSVPISTYFDECRKSVYMVLNKGSESEQLKKTALYAARKLTQMEDKQSGAIINFLHQIMENQKEKPGIRANALYVLYEIQETTKTLQTLTLDFDTCMDMLELLPALNEWDNSRLLDSLTGNYIPQNHSDAHYMIEKTIPQLQHANTSVVLNAFKFVIYLTNYVDFLMESLVKQLSASIISLLNKPPELEFLVLRNIILLLIGREKPILSVDVSYFFVEFNDPIYIKDTKLEILYLLAKEDNLSQILQELKEYATDIDIQMSRKAIRAVGNLAVKLERCVDECMNLLLELLDFEVEYIVQEIVSVFKNVLRRYPEKYEICLFKLIHFTDSVQEPESRGSMIWIITQYSDHLRNYLELFQSFTDNFLNEALEVQFSILSSVIKLFTRNPTPATEKLCIDILKCSTEKSDCPDLRDRAFMYWRLLSSAQQSQGSLIDMNAVREIVDGALPVIALNSHLDPQIVEELELNIGTIASIYLKPVGQVFRLNKPRRLPRSPAFNSNRDGIEVISENSRSHSSSLTEKSSGSRPRRKSSPVKKMEDYDRPAETINQLKLKKKTSSAAMNLTRKPSILARKLSMRKPFA